MKKTVSILCAIAFALAGCNHQGTQKQVQKTEDMNAENVNTEVPKISDFPSGNENTAYAQYFSGKSWLAPLTQMSGLNVPMSNVTFEPGCRNNWHSHTGGQILVAVGG